MIDGRLRGRRWSCDLTLAVVSFPQYEVKAPMPSACFRNVCKQMAKMHEAICELLPEEQMQVRETLAGFERPSKTLEPTNPVLLRRCCS